MLQSTALNLNDDWEIVGEKFDVYRPCCGFSLYYPSFAVDENATDVMLLVCED